MRVALIILVLTYLCVVVESWGGFKNIGGAIRRTAQNAGRGIQRTGGEINKAAHKTRDGAVNAGRVTARFAEDTSKKAAQTVVQFTRQQAEGFVRDYIMSYTKIIEQAEAVGDQAQTGSNKFTGTTRRSFENLGAAASGSAKDGVKFAGFVAKGSAGFAVTSGQTAGEMVKIAMPSTSEIKNYILKTFKGDLNGAKRDIENDMKEKVKKWKRAANEANKKFKDQVAKFKDGLDKARNELKKGLQANFGKAKGALIKLGKGIKTAGKDFVKLYNEVDKLFATHPLLSMLKSMGPLGLVDSIKNMVKLGKSGKWADLTLCILDTVGDIASIVPGIGTQISSAISVGTSVARFAIAVKEGRYEDGAKELAGIKIPGAGKFIKVTNKVVKTGNKAVKVYDFVRGDTPDGDMKPDDDDE